MQNKRKLIVSNSSLATSDKFIYFTMMKKLFITICINIADWLGSSL